MITPLRAYLMLNLDGAWKITVHRELEDLLMQWRECPNPGQACGIVHIGFERPPSNLFTDMAAEHQGRILLTASARFGLPSGFEASSFPIGDAGGLPIYLATKGWGYLIDPTSIEFVRPQTVAPKKTYGWVTSFLAANEPAAEHFHSALIADDADYLQREDQLPDGIRLEAAIFRVEALLRDRDDPCDLARAAPPWLQSRPFNTIDLTVRVSNVLVNRSIVTVHDLAQVSLSALLGTQNFGRKSAGDLLYSLRNALHQGPRSEFHATPDGLIHLSEGTLIEQIEGSLEGLSERTSNIIRQRMGLGQPAQTLQQLGERFGVTRERIRQIEAKAIAKILREETWDDILSHKISALLRERSSPLPLRGIDAADSWFSGVGSNGEVLQYLLEYLPTHAKVVEIGGVEYLGFVSQSQWDQAVSSSKALLDFSAQRRLSLAECQSAVLAELPRDAHEFRDLLWDYAARDCHFVNHEGTEVLIGFGRGAEHAVHAALIASERPLHYTEIARVVNQGRERDFDLRRIHNAAASVGQLFELGTYGLDKHIPLSADELLQLAQDAFEIVEAGPRDRQWHSNELLGELFESEQASPEKATKYILDMALKRSGALQNLGRMVWGSAREQADPGARIDIRQAIVAILENAGGPLSVDRIRQRVQDMRGLDKPFQMHIVDPVLRLGPRLYGLNDRDIAIKRVHQPAVMDDICQWLEEHQFGIHQSELEGSSFAIRAGVSGLILFGIASNDERMRVSAGRYLYLEAWGEPRRESLAQAIRAVMEESGGQLVMGQLMSRVSTRIGRSTERTAIAHALKSLDSNWDASTGLWSLPSAANELDDEFV